jgi:hypothetical protein
MTALEIIRKRTSTNLFNSGSIADWKIQAVRVTTSKVIPLIRLLVYIGYFARKTLPEFEVHDMWYR